MSCILYSPSWASLPFNVNCVIFLFQEFILCRKENKDPRKCLDLGKAVTACSLNFFRQVKKSCAQEFTQFATCLEKSSSDFSFEPWVRWKYEDNRILQRLLYFDSRCRKTQAVLDKCMLDNLGLERPYYGYFSEVKVLHSDQPRPEVPKTEFPDVPARVAEEETQQASKFGSRKYFMNWAENAILAQQLLCRSIVITVIHEWGV